MARPQTQHDAVREVWEVLRRYPWRFALPAFLAAAAVLAGAMLLPRRYRAEAIFDRRNDMVLSEITTRGAAQTFQSPRQSMVDEIIGPVAIDQLIKSFKQNPELAAKIERHHQLRGEMTRGLVVRFDVASPDLDRPRVSFVHNDPEIAQLVVNGLVEHYIARTRANIDTRLQQSENFFRSEADSERTTIEDLENKQLEMEIAHAALLPENGNGIQMAVVAAQAELADAKQRRDAARLRLEALNESLKETSEVTPSYTTTRNPELERMETRLRDMQAQLQLYLSGQKMTERHPDVVDLRHQIAATEKALASASREVVTQKQTTPNQHHSEVALMLKTATAEMQAHEKLCSNLEAKIAALESSTDDLFPVRADYRKLTRDIETHRRQLAFWEDNLRRVRLAATAENGNRGVQLDFVKPCDTIDRPVSPDMVQAVVAAIGLALLTGAASVFIAHRADESFRDGRDLAACFNVPLMGTVSELISRQQQRLRRLQQSIAYPAAIAALAAILIVQVGVLHMSLERPHDFAAFKREPLTFLTGKLLGPRSAQAAPTKE